MGTSPNCRARQVIAQVHTKTLTVPCGVVVASATEAYVSQPHTHVRPHVKPQALPHGRKKTSDYLDCPLTQRNQLVGHVTRGVLDD